MIPGVGMLDGHNAIVTGGGSGIGEAISRRFAADGARVAVLDRRVEAARSVASAVGGIALECDVASSSSVDAAIEAAAAEMGGVTELVNNAGLGMNKPLHQYTDNEWALVVGVNSDASSPALECLAS